MATLREARMARKRAVSRISYYAKKAGIGTYKDFNYQLPTVEKGLSPERYDQYVEMFDNIVPEDIKDLVEEQKQEPAPDEISYIQIFSDTLQGLDPMIGDQFDNAMSYLIDYTSSTIDSIDQTLGQHQDWLSQMMEAYYKYLPKGKDAAQYACLYIFNQGMEEYFNMRFSA